jgi:16S rRNA (guanine966-N2)-methyltransferase
MRIIAGLFRGRKLVAPEGLATRPITDRVKQSLFDILTPRLADSIVYDCFAGTGSMGLESLSRGCSSVAFFESDRSAVSRLRRNISTLSVENQARIVSTDLFRYFSDTRNAPAPDGRAKIVFLDPPYRFVTERAKELLGLARDLMSRHLAPGGLVVFRHDSAVTLGLPPLLPHDSRGYGSMTLDFLVSEGTA